MIQFEQLGFYLFLVITRDTERRNSGLLHDRMIVDYAGAFYWMIKCESSEA